ncbi:MAG: AAA family ATPase [Gammaproteobacteria bacterium]|nr:AAA family ATPase [Gammaproteobacteria bacterium]
MSGGALYLEHFGLGETPFSLTPDTSFFYAYRSHQEALDTLLVALRAGEGFIKVTGEVGLGKTLVCRKLLRSLGDPFVTAYIPNPHLSPGAMRQAIADELSVKLPTRATQNEVVRAITRRLLELATEGKQVVVILDEAQELPAATLEAVRLLTNLETEKRKLLQVVLFGQPELDRRLNERNIRQLKQRITFSYVLRPLDIDAMDEYIRHRLRIAGYRGAQLFDRAALRKIFVASRGTPRLVNILCHKAMMVAYGRGLDAIGRQEATPAIEDTEGAMRVRNWWPLAAGGALAGMLLGFVWYYHGGGWPLP